MRRFPVRWAVIAVAVLAIAGLGYWGVKSLSSDKTGGNLIMATKPVMRGDIEVSVRGWGMLQAREERDVLSGAKGVVKDVFFQSGQSVTKGQVLASIDPGSLAVELKTQEITLETKKVALARGFGVSPGEVENVNPETALVLRSPMTGRLAGLTVDTGSTASGKICSVVDDRRLIIKMQVGKPVFDTVQVGTKATFRPSRFDDRDEGVVTRADPTPIQGNQAYFYEVWVEIPNPGLLKVGDAGALVFHGSTGDITQDARISSCGSEEAVNAAFSGRVKRIFVRDGMMVKQGDPILEFEAGETLLNAMTAQLEIKSLAIRAEDLRLQLQNLTIVSPIEGVALTRDINPGQQVDKGNQVTRVSNFTNMDLMLQVDEMDVPKIQVGQQASVTVWGPSGQQSIPADVSRLGATGNQRDGISSFNITLAVSNPGFIRPGMGAEAKIFVSKKGNVLLCPVEALYKENDQWLVDSKDGKDRTPIPVKVGVMNDTFAEVLEGLSEGQEVVVGMSKTDSTQSGGGSSPVKMPSGKKVIR